MVFLAHSLAGALLAAGACSAAATGVGGGGAGTTASAAGTTASAAAGREKVKFDFSWRHTLLHGPAAPPAPPAPAPVGPTHCPHPDSFPANVSGTECGGLSRDAAAATADACAINCCNDQACAVWQFGTNLSSGGGCWRGECDGGKTPVPGSSKNWVGGARPNRQQKPPLPPPPPPPPAPGTNPEEAAPSFDDSAWKAVDLPHDMHIDAAPDYASCPNGCSGRSYLARHTGWYRKKFFLPQEWAGSAVSVVFEGAFHYSMIYLNGVLLTNHSCGYTSFDVPLPASSLKFGSSSSSSSNIIAVYTDATSGTGWWYEGGGLFRHVWLMKRAPVHLTSFGLFVAPKVHESTIVTTAAAAEVNAGVHKLQAAASLNISAVVTAPAALQSGTIRQVAASFELLDNTGATVAAFDKTAAVNIPAGGGEVALLAMVDVPQAVSLWTIRAPTLYTVRTTLLVGGLAVDEANTTVGFRSLRYDADTGFHMNEQHVKIRGFCDHNDFANVGVGVPDRINLYRAQAARSIGGNGRRTSHNPPDPSMLDIYDRVGIAVMDENRDFEVGQKFYDNMADLVQRDRNHPSVVIWSFCNEGGCTPTGAAGPGFRHVSYEFDGTRPVLGNMIGGCTDEGCTGQFGNNLTMATDVQGFSHSGRSTIASFHKLFPQKPLFESECCSCNTQRGENTCQGVGCQTASATAMVGASDHPQHDTNGLEASFNADCLAYQTNTSNGVPWMSGSMVWTLFDYYGEPSFGGWPHVSSTFGSFDLAGFAKPAVWWYRSYWLLDVPDTSADKPFATPGEHTVRIVESWEKPKIQPSLNVTDAVACDANDPAQHITFDESSGRITGANGLCLDGTCSSIATGCSPLKFASCMKDQVSQKWEHTADNQFINADNKGCIDLWGSGAGPGIGVYICEKGDLGQEWVAEGSGFKTAADKPPNPSFSRCLSNGIEYAGAVVHVYSSAPAVELLINGESVGVQALRNPQLTPGADSKYPAQPTAQSWATYTVAKFVPGNLTAVALDPGNTAAAAALATHTVLTGGAAAKLVLTLDAPNPRSGTGDALLLDGQDAGLVRATIVDGAGQLVADATHNVTFEIVSGPGRIVGAHNGDPQCHEPNQVAWHSAYHGLVRAVVMTTEDKASPAWHRKRLVEIDAENGLQTTVIADPVAVGGRGVQASSNGIAPPAPIMLKASCDGLPATTISIPTSSDAALDSVYSVAEASAGKKVVIE